MKELICLILLVTLMNGLYFWVKPYVIDAFYNYRLKKWNKKQGNML